MSRPWIERLWGPGGVHLLIGDAAVIAALLLAVGGPFLLRGGGGRPESALVDVSGRRVMNLDLSRDAVTEVAGPRGVTRIEVRDRGARVLSSPCPLGICRHGGRIDAAGDMLVCLPNETVIRLPGRPPGAPDAVSR